MTNHKTAYLFLGLVVLCASIPLWVKDPYFLHILIISHIWAILALSINIIFGYTGQVTLGHSAFFGIGAYASALLMIKLGWSFWLALPMAGLISGFFGLLIGYPSLLTKDIEFIVVTLGFGIIVWQLFVNWVGLTKGPLGLSDIPSPSIEENFLFPAFSFSSKSAYYYLVFMTLVASVFVVHRLVNSRVGKAMMSIRDDEELAESLGINSMFYKVMAFVISTFFAGVAGSLYAHYLKFVSPETFTYMASFEMLVITVIGGIGTIAGPIIGAFVLTSIPEFLRAAIELRMLFYGLFLLIAIVFMPYGILGLIKTKFIRT
jgi:branched-chain amino acid transport system permease protein